MHIHGLFFKMIDKNRKTIHPTFKSNYHRAPHSTSSNSNKNISYSTIFRNTFLPVISPMSRFIQCPDIMSERAGVQKIRMRDHFLWPFFQEMTGCDDSDGDQLMFEPGQAPLRKGIDLVWPTGHVYEFGTGRDAIIFYAQSGLVSVRGALHAVFYEHVHVLGSYAWLADQISGGAGCVVIPNAGLSYKTIRRGKCEILRIEGLHIHRSTGEIVRWIRESGETRIGTGFSDCMRIRPRVPWHTRNFYTGGATASLIIDLAVIRIQRWMRKKCKELWSTKEVEFWNLFRDFGHFAHLTDDLFRLVVQQTVRAQVRTQTRVIGCDLMYGLM